MGCLLFKLDGVPGVLYSLYVFGTKCGYKRYLILQLVSTVIGVALFREKLVEGFKNFIKRPFIRDLAIGYALRIGLAIAVAQLIGDVTSITKNKLKK